MTLSLLINSFYFGLAVRYRYALDTLVGGDFLQCNGDESFNAIKKILAANGTPHSVDKTFASIMTRLSNLELTTQNLNECYLRLRREVNDVGKCAEPSNWFPIIRVEINAKKFNARCDITTEPCLMPKSIYDSLNLWGAIEGGEEITLQIIPS